MPEWPRNNECFCSDDQNRKSYSPLGNCSNVMFIISNVRTTVNAEDPALDTEHGPYQWMHKSGSVLGVLTYTRPDPLQIEVSLIHKDHWLCEQFQSSLSLALFPYHS